MMMPDVDGSANMNVVDINGDGKTYDNKIKTEAEVKTDLHMDEQLVGGYAI